MVLGIALGCIFVGVIIVSLRVMMAVNRYEEIRKDSERD